MNIGIFQIQLMNTLLNLALAHLKFFSFSGVDVGAMKLSETYEKNYLKKCENFLLPPHHICWGPDTIILLEYITDAALSKWVQDVCSDIILQAGARRSWQEFLAGNVSCRLPTQIIFFFPESFGSCLPSLQLHI